jgi:hypothetical protein
MKDFDRIDLIGDAPYSGRWTDLRIGGRGGDVKEKRGTRRRSITTYCFVWEQIKCLKVALQRWYIERARSERLGYFCIDPDNKDEKLIFNRTATLRDEWAKIQQTQSENK